MIKSTSIIIANAIDSPIGVLHWVIAGGSVAGLANIFWSYDFNAKVPHGVMVGRVLGAVILSGVASAIIFLAAWKYMGNENLYLLIALSLLGGVGGASTIDFLTAIVKRWASRVIGENGGK